MNKFISLIAVIFIFVSCNTSGTDSKGNESFEKLIIQSLNENEIELLENNFATKELYRFIVPEKINSDGFIDTFLTEYTLRIKASWEKVAEIVMKKKIDFSKLKIKEWLVHNPFKDKEKDVQVAVLVYEYDGKTWDDLTFIIANMNRKTYLLEIPNPTRAFSFADTTLRNRSDAILYTEIKDSAFVPRLHARVKEIIQFAKGNNILKMTENTVYGGEDSSRRWNAAMNPSDVKELEHGGALVKSINEGLDECNDNYTFSFMNYERESEGVWIVQNVTCGNRIVYFAFLKVGDKLLLGEVNIEEK